METPIMRAALLFSVLLETFLRGMETERYRPRQRGHSNLETFLRGMETNPAWINALGASGLETFLRGMETHAEVPHREGFQGP